ncbi:MAG: hypothetical protein RSB36_03160 [Hydrogenoanaerobacterium sp.]
MVPIYFSASLETDTKQVLEIGEACVSETDDAITFTSGFVPLIKLGTTVHITRVLGGHELNRFIGKVYLSSSKLLQIVGVEHELICDMRRLFSVNELASTSLVLAPKASADFTPQKTESIFGVVRYLSMNIIKIFSMEYIPDGQYLVFSLDTPGIKLTNMLVQVRERVLLKRNAALHICTVVKPSHENGMALAAYSVRKKQNSLN